MTAKQNDDAIERRRNRLHDDDLQAMVLQITNALSNQHSCRFPAIKTEDMSAVIPFMLKFKKLSEKIGTVILVVIVTAFTGGLIAIFSRGFWGSK